MVRVSGTVAGKNVVQGMTVEEARSLQELRARAKPARNRVYTRRNSIARLEAVSYTHLRAHETLSDL
eukprot:355482-Karenia_brevis.AAC.1